jgi:CheY-like chemotaxis protein/HAMP domain-containing protein
MERRQAITRKGENGAHLDNLLGALRAVRNGDFSVRIEYAADGIMGEIAEAFNDVVTLNEQIIGELVRINTVVGLEGNMAERASMGDVRGGWMTGVDSINSLIVNLAQPTAETARVLTAVARGDLSRGMALEIDDRPLQGEFLAIGNVVNTMVAQLNGFASEVTRVAREVGTEGVLGGQAEMPGVSGVWKDLTDSVNAMAGSLTSQVRNIAEVTTAVAQGDLSRKITVEASGDILELKDTINRMVDNLNTFAGEVSRVAWEVGTEGKLGGQAYVRGVSGVWKDLTDNVNQMANNLTDQVRDIALVSTAVANGDLSQKITVEAKGEILQLKNTVNKMVDQLNAFGSEVTRVAREVGTEGKLGGQAQVLGVAGVWKDLTDNVNAMGGALTSQVRDIAKVTIAVANGDLSQKISVGASGEILQLKDTINKMVDQLNAFGSEVTRVAREVGSEGKLGGQAQVRGVSGVWKDLTDNVNQLAGNLTNQVRAIAKVATAVSQGDLSRSITVEAFGEVAELKDNVNRMIITLRDTTRHNEEQDWLKTNLARFTRMLPGQRDLQTVAQLVMSELTPLVNGHQGVFYVMDTSGENGLSGVLRLLSSYAYVARRNVSTRWLPGEGLVGQCALEKKPILLYDVPDDYVRITSGLSDGKPRDIIVLPVVFEGRVLAVVELASYQRFSETHIAFLEQLMESLGVVLNMIQASMRTEELLKESQKLAEELQTKQADLTRSNRELEEQAQALEQSQDQLRAQQEELKTANDELKDKAKRLEEQKHVVEQKNRELELAQASLEEKAEQLAITSKYKSEFLANMSHELRTPLNSMLLLSGLLVENKQQNLTSAQMEYVQTIHSSAQDLLSLINEILDLSKIEAGRMDLDVTAFPPAEIRVYVERAFRQLAEQKGLSFQIEVAEDSPSMMRTDRNRLERILRNLLSNAFKFTERGEVALEVRSAEPGVQFESQALIHADQVISFSVKDTGIGIPREKQKIVWEAFEQVDATAGRRFGGTGLGLTIVREIARLLGGEIHLVSEEGIGSTFTLYLPVRYVPVSAAIPARPKAADTPSPGAGVHPEGPTSGAPLESATVDASGVAPDLASVTGADVSMMPEIIDDRYEIRDGDRVVLIIEDDDNLACILRDVARERGFKALVALRGDTGLALAHELKPDAIILDIKLPVMDGWTILERLKSRPDLRHIPVHVISVMEERKKAAYNGAIAYLTKPVDRQSVDDAFVLVENFIERNVRQLLVVENDKEKRDEIVSLIGDSDVQTTAVENGAHALEALRGRRFDCMVLDPALPDMKGVDLLEQMVDEPGAHELPVIVYVPGEQMMEQAEELDRYSSTMIIKYADSQARLLDETALFLHRVEGKLSEDGQRMIRQLHEPASGLAGTKVLIVDDDIRNVFALTSVLESHGVEVKFAKSGKDGIETLEADPDIDLVLMDIMMPEMDGYETIRIIRGNDRYSRLPIVALTAKAMKGDREKCFEAGASDYISKPVDVARLISVLKVWVSHERHEMHERV